MKSLHNLTQLITIRQYVAQQSSNLYNDSKLSRELDGVVLLLDQKIVKIINSESFKKLIDYDSLPQLKQQTALNNSIYKDLPKK